MAPASHVGVEGLSVARRLGGATDDALRGGAALGDDVARGSRLGPVAGEARLGEGPLAKVADDVAPGAGASVEEALVEAGGSLALEVVDADLPADAREGGGRWPRLLDTEAANFRSVVQGVLDGAGGLVTVVGEADEEGRIRWIGGRATEIEVHRARLEKGARCATLVCEAHAGATCLATARRVHDAATDGAGQRGTDEARYTRFVWALLQALGRAGGRRARREPRRQGQHRSERRRAARTRPDSERHTQGAQAADLTRLDRGVGWHEA